MRWVRRLNELRTAAAEHGIFRLAVVSATHAIPARVGGTPENPGGGHVAIGRVGDGEGRQGRTSLTRARPVGVRLRPSPVVLQAAVPVLSPTSISRFVWSLHEPRRRPAPRIDLTAPSARRSPTTLGPTLG